jgi:hypothetical protein
MSQSRGTSRWSKIISEPKKEGTMKNLTLGLVSLMLLGNTSFAQINNQNIEGFFATVFSASNSGVGVLGNNSNPHLAPLKCEGGFEAEDVFSIRCSSGSTAEDQNAGYFLFVNDAFVPGNPGTLVVTTSEGRMEVTLHCTMRNSTNPSLGVNCK